MKKIFLAALFLVCSLLAFAQERGPLAVGFGLEWNMDSRFNFAGGAVLGADYNLNKTIALGLNLTGSTNFLGISVLEPSAMVRAYIWENCHGRLFLQLDLGAFIIFEEGDVTPMPEAGLRGGFRKPLGSSFYIEPYGRLGYPFAFGVGFMAGKFF